METFVHNPPKVGSKRAGVLTRLPSVLEGRIVGRETLIFADHAVEETGVPLELLLVAGALLLLGIASHIRGIVKPPASMTLVVTGLALGAGAFALSGERGPPPPTSVDATITIVSPDEGATLPTDEWVPVEVTVEGAQVGTSAADDTARVHVFRDGEIVAIPSGTRAEIMLLDPGEHTITAELVRDDHVSYEPKVLDEITVVARDGGR